MHSLLDHQKLCLDNGVHLTLPYDATRFSEETVEMTDRLDVQTPHENPNAPQKINRKKGDSKIPSNNVSK